MKTLVLVEHDNVRVKDATLNTVAAAAKLGEVNLLVAGMGCAGVGDQAANIAGVAKVHVADAASLEHQLPENVAPLVVGLMADHDAFLASTTTTGKNIAPRVAALLDVMQISDIIGVEGPDRFTRPIYAGNAIAKVLTSDKKLVITVRGTAFEKAAAEGGSAAVETVGVADDAGIASFVSAEIAASERPELTSARVIVSGGRGVGSGENYRNIIDRLAD
jgi:electron transfer flavoprotein alpha subunit